MLWLPWIRRIPPGWLRVVMALTVGLLAFLAIDATLEGFELAGEGSQAFGGAALVLVGAAVAYLLLTGVVRLAGQAARGPRRRPARRARRSRCSSRSASACTTSARASRSARPTRPARSRSARSSSSASRCTTRPRGWRSSRRSRTSRPSLGRLAVLGLIAGRARGARRVDRRRGVQLQPRRVPVRLRRRRDRPGDRPARAVAARRARAARCTRPRSAGLLAGMALMFATGLLVSV